jgi:hypothetical protein
MLAALSRGVQSGTWRCASGAGLRSGDGRRWPQRGARQGIGGTGGGHGRDLTGHASWLPVALQVSSWWQLQCSGSASGSEEDGGFVSLSSCNLDGDGMRGGRKEVSVVAEGSEYGGRRCGKGRRRGDPTGGGAERGRAVTVACHAQTRRLQTRAVDASMAQARGNATPASQSGRGTWQLSR